MEAILKSRSFQRQFSFSVKFQPFKPWLIPLPTTLLFFSTGSQSGSSQIWNLAQRTLLEVLKYLTYILSIVSRSSLEQVRIDSSVWPPLCGSQLPLRWPPSACSSVLAITLRSLRGSLKNQGYAAFDALHPKNDGPHCSTTPMYHTYKEVKYTQKLIFSDDWILQLFCMKLSVNLNIFIRF